MADLMSDGGGPLEILRQALNQLDKRVDDRFIALERRIYDKFASEEKVRDETKEALDARLEVMNEFRSQLNRQASSFVTWWGLGSVLVAFAMFVIAATTLIVKLTMGK